MQNQAYPLPDDDVVFRLLVRAAKRHNAEQKQVIILFREKGIDQANSESYRSVRELPASKKGEIHASCESCVTLWADRSLPVCSRFGQHLHQSCGPAPAEQSDGDNNSTRCILTGHSCTAEQPAV